MLLASTRELPKGCASADSGRQAAAEAAKAQEVKRHVDGLYAKAAEVLRERLLAREQAAAEAAAKEEGHKRRCKGAGTSAANTVAPAHPPSDTEQRSLLRDRVKTAMATLESETTITEFAIWSLSIECLTELAASMEEVVKCMQAR